MKPLDESATLEEWQTQLGSVVAEHGAGWESQYGPGTFGCHELLDRLNLVGDLVEAQISNHPSCALRLEWHRLAMLAVESLRELYQRVGQEHFVPEGKPSQAQPLAQTGTELFLTHNASSGTLVG